MHKFEVACGEGVNQRTVVPRIECGTHSQVFSVYHERGGDGAGTSHPTAGPGDVSRACPRPSNRSLEDPA